MFEVGDKVVCIKESKLDSPGKLHEVLTIRGFNGSDLLFEEYPEDMGCMPSRFALFKPAANRVTTDDLKDVYAKLSLYVSLETLNTYKNKYKENYKEEMQKSLERGIK